LTGFFVLQMARRRRLRRKMAGFFAKTRRGGAAEKMHTPPSVEFFVLPMAKRRWRTFCTSSRFGEYRVGKMSRIFRPADDETPPLYFVYSKAARRRQGGKLSDGQRFYLS